MDIVNALAKLGKKLTGGTAPTGSTVADVLLDIEDKWSGAGADGASVTAIALTTEDGAVTGGTATLSDGTEIEITVTTT